MTTLTIVGLDPSPLIVSTITDLVYGTEGGPTMGQLIMLGTLFGLIVVIFGVVIYFDPEARAGKGRDQ